MKRKTAKEILAESFQELAEKKPVDKITVKDITGNCGYSTATFYRHFRDKYDLIAWYHAAGTAEIMAKIGKDGYTTYDILKEYYQDEEEDMYWGESQLELIECIGKQNWLLQQL